MSKQDQKAGQRGTLGGVGFRPKEEQPKIPIGTVINSDHCPEGVDHHAHVSKLTGCEVKPTLIDGQGQAHIGVSLVYSEAGTGIETLTGNVAAEARSCTNSGNATGVAKLGSMLATANVLFDLATTLVHSTTEAPWVFVSSLLALLKCRPCMDKRQREPIEQGLLTWLSCHVEYFDWLTRNDAPGLDRQSRDTLLSDIEALVDRSLK